MDREERTCTYEASGNLSCPNGDTVEPFILGLVAIGTEIKNAIKPNKYNNQFPAFISPSKNVIEACYIGCSKIVGIPWDPYKGVFNEGDQVWDCECNSFDECNRDKSCFRYYRPHNWYNPKIGDLPKKVKGTREYCGEVCSATRGCKGYIRRTYFHDNDIDGECILKTGFSEDWRVASSNGDYWSYIRTWG